MKFGAIDIGSNAVRLLITRLVETESGPIFKKDSLVRLPIRLGQDVFTTGAVGKEKEKKLLNTLQAFKLLMGVHEVVSFRVCATSAMRNARNKDDLVAAIFNRTGMKVDVIDGSKEADIIFSNHIEEHLYRDRSYLYIDVGGGSTELTVFAENRPVASRSFRIGTIRLLENKVEPEYWNKMLDWVEDHTQHLGKLDSIGSGGNINKLYKMAEVTEGKPLGRSELKKLHVMLRQMTYDQRISELGLNPDRADVIVPACGIFRAILKRAGIKDIIVPQFGLADGMTRQLYYQHVGQRD